MSTDLNVRGPRGGMTGGPGEPHDESLMPGVRVSRTGKWLADYGLTAALFVGLLVVWQLVTFVFGIRSYLLPSPYDMFVATGENFGLLMSQSVTTVIEIVLGFLASAVLGFPLALLIVFGGRLGDAVNRLMVAFQIIPKIAIAPAFVILVGTGLFPKVIFVFMLAFFPVIVNSVLGIKSVDRDFIECARAMGATTRQAFVKVRLPHALPVIMSGLKIAMTLAVIGAIVAEFVGAGRGLGYLMMVATGNVQTPLAYADLLVLTVIGVALYMVIGIVEHIVLRNRKPTP